MDINDSNLSLEVELDRHDSLERGKLVGIH